MSTKNDTLHHPDYHTSAGGGDHRRLGVLHLRHGLREEGGGKYAKGHLPVHYILCALSRAMVCTCQGFGAGYSLDDAPNHSVQHAVVGGGDHQLLDAPQLPSLRGGGGAQVKSGLSLPMSVGPTAVFTGDSILISTSPCMRGGSLHSSVP